MKKKRTTVYINKDIFTLLRKISLKTGSDKKEIIKKALREIAGTRPLLEKYGELSTYQDDYPSWERYHITFTPEECELNSDLKKLFKVTLSYLIALAILLYSDSEIFKVDNYPALKTLYYTISEKNSLSAIFLWEIQKNKAKNQKARKTKE